MWKFRGGNQSPVTQREPATGVQDAAPASPEATPRVIVAPDPEVDDVAFVNRRLLQYNVEQAGPSMYRPLAVFLRGRSGGVLGGITGSTYWGWLVIECLWIPEDLRSKGYGTQLLAAIENQARGRACHHACLDTFTFQGAIRFYETRGYVRSGSLPSFPVGQQRVYFYKALTL